MCTTVSVCFPFLDAGLDASSQALHHRNHILVLTGRAGAWRPFTEGMSGPTREVTMRGMALKGKDLVV